MQALFDYDGLKEHGIENIVDYFNSFIDETYEAVWTSRGRFESQITPEQFMASSPKMRYVMECIQSVKTYHETRKEPISGQVIYSNRGTKFFPHIKEFLVKKIGFKPAEVQIIIGGTSTKKKEKIKEEFLSGKVKIIIGSATIREGIDLQKKASVLYNCYLD